VIKYATPDAKNCTYFITKGQKNTLFFRNRSVFPVKLASHTYSDNENFAKHQQPWAQNAPQLFIVAIDDKVELKASFIKPPAPPLRTRSFAGAG
jgi:hypothetical protein